MGPSFRFLRAGPDRLVLFQLAFGSLDAPLVRAGPFLFREERE